MKGFVQICLWLLGMAAVEAGLAQESIRLPAERDAGIGIEQVGVLVYPPSMLADAIFSGQVQAVISVDAEGKLTDWLHGACFRRGRRRRSSALALSAGRLQRQPPRVASAYCFRISHAGRRRADTAGRVDEADVSYRS